MIDKRDYESEENVSTDTLPRLVRAAVQECWPHVQDDEMIGISFGLGGGAGEGPSMQTSWHFRNEKQLLDLPAVRTFLDYLWEKDWDYKLRDEYAMQNMRERDRSEWNREAFSATITRAFAKAPAKDEVRYVRERVDELAEQLIEHLSSDEPLFMELVPLANFKYEGPEMAWGEPNPISLRKLTDHETQLLHNAGVYGRTAYHARENPQWCMATLLSREEATASGWISARLLSYLGALQMTKERHFVPVTILYYPTRWLESVSCQWMGGMTSWAGMSVDSADLRDLEERASHIMAALRLKTDSYRVFLRRYMLAYERRRPDTK